MKKILSILFALSMFIFSAQIDNEVFKIKTVDNKELTIKGTDEGVLVSPYEGKVIFIEFWGTWCGPCLLSIPHHEAMQEKYKGKLKIISFEVTPDVTKEKLLKFKNNPAQEIDMSKVQWYLDNKAKSPQAKAYLAKPVEELKEFKKSNKKITYDIVSSKDGYDFVYYIQQRARWGGGIPFLIAVGQDGKVLDIVQGMPSQDSLEAIMQKALKNSSANNKNNQTKDSNTTK